MTTVKGASPEYVRWIQFQFISGYTGNVLSEQDVIEKRASRETRLEVMDENFIAVFHPIHSLMPLACRCFTCEDNRTEDFDPLEAEAERQEVSVQPLPRNQIDSAAEHHMLSMLVEDEDIYHAMAAYGQYCGGSVDTFLVRPVFTDDGLIFEVSINKML